MKNKLTSLLLLCLAFLCFFGGAPVRAEDAPPSEQAAEQALEEILAFKGVDSYSIQRWVTGELTETAGIGAEWYVLALAQMEDCELSSYEASLLDYLASHTVRSASTRQKYAVCLASVGSIDSYISATLSDSIGKQGLMSWVFGLHLLNNGYVSEEHTAESVKARLLELQLADGGWSVMGQAADADATAMTVQALAVFYAEDSMVRQAVDKALALLSEKQLPDGDYISYGVPNPESTAQVMIALSALGIDYSLDSRFIKNGNTLLDGMLKYRLTNGSFSHSEGGTSHESATSQVFLALSSYLRMKAGEGSVFLLEHARPTEVQLPPAEPSEPMAPPPADEVPNEPTESTLLGDYRLWVSLALVALGGAWCLCLYLRGKRRIENFISVGVAVALAVVAVCFTRIQSVEDYYQTHLDVIEEGDETVFLSVRCDAVLEHWDQLDPSLRSEKYVPSNGVIHERREYVLRPGDTVYDLLVRVLQHERIQMESSVSLGNAAYVQSINHLYEFSCGETSGWRYTVNGAFSDKSCSAYVLQDGDEVVWQFTCDIGGAFEGEVKSE